MHTVQNACQLNWINLNIKSTCMAVIQYMYMEKSPCAHWRLVDCRRIGRIVWAWSRIAFTKHIYIAVMATIRIFWLYHIVPHRVDIWVNSIWFDYLRIWTNCNIVLHLFYTLRLRETNGDRPQSVRFGLHTRHRRLSGPSSSAASAPAAAATGVFVQRAEPVVGAKRWVIFCCLCYDALCVCGASVCIWYAHVFFVVFVIGWIRSIHTSEYSSSGTQPER